MTPAPTSTETKAIESGFVYLGGLMHATLRALTIYAERRGYEWLEDRSYIEPQWAAWLILLLQREGDDPELFPHGKWATIQRLEKLVEDAAMAEVLKGGSNA